MTAFKLFMVFNQENEVIGLGESESWAWSNALKQTPSDYDRNYLEHCGYTCRPVTVTLGHDAPQRLMPSDWIHDMECAIASLNTAWSHRYSNEIKSAREHIYALMDQMRASKAPQLVARDDWRKQIDAALCGYAKACLARDGKAMCALKEQVETLLSEVTTAERPQLVAGAGWRERFQKAAYAHSEALDRFEKARGAAEYQSMIDTNKAVGLMLDEVTELPAPDENETDDIQASANDIIFLRGRDFATKYGAALLKAALAREADGGNGE